MAGHEEEEYGLVYNMWINFADNAKVEININEGGTLIMQTGKPEGGPGDPPPPVGP